jgi:DNA-binding NarL/FixJ family response regulator
MLDESRRYRAVMSTLRDRTAVVVDREPEWLEAVVKVLAAMPVTVVGKTASLEVATALVKRHRPDFVVVGLTTDDDEERGVSWITEARSVQADLKVVALAAANDAATVEGAFAAGADVCIVRRRDPRDVAVAVRQVFERSLYLATDRTPADDAGPVDSLDLTTRELDILRLASDGLSNVQIASQLWITEQTVKFHLSNIYRKLDVTNRTQAARQAHLRNILPRRASEQARSEASGRGRPRS